MKIFLFWCFIWVPISSLAATLDDTINTFESAWASIYYRQDNTEKARDYEQLLLTIKKSYADYPQQPELIFFEALVTASRAEYLAPLAALDSIAYVRTILSQIITLKPSTMAGSAYVVLATLYHQAPAWPIAFGDDKKAEELFKAALTINPNSLDGNYYYGQFLVAKNAPKDAEFYFKQTVKIPLRPKQLLSDSQLRLAAQQALTQLAQQQERSWSTGKQE
ncbi:MAG: hypothetical protein ACOYM1_08010 [Methylovulum sp.]|jgi:hypothetical protein